MNQTYMKEKPVLGLMLSLSLPMVISMLVNTLYNIVDSYFVARYSAAGLTALSIIFPIQLLMTALAAGTGTGMNILISRMEMCIRDRSIPVRDASRKSGFREAKAR